MSTLAPLRVGIVGVGAISGQYLDTLARLESLSLAGVADVDAERAEQVAADRGTTAMSVEQLLAHPQVDVVLNLTIPAAHAEVCLQAIAAGKHVYTEKPLAASVAQAREVLAAANQAGLTVGCAPDTVLGTGTQTARKAIADGLIGTPAAASAVMVTAGHERWHPAPDFYYQPGGGPLLDMGPYYVSSLVHLLGPVESVIGASNRVQSTRTIGSGARQGEVIEVGVDSHVTGVLTHATGVLSTITMSFDSLDSRASRIEVHGTSGSLVVPDPNGFDGTVELNTGEGFVPLEPSAGYRDGGRGIGLADWAGTPSRAPRASGELGFHVLEVMESLLDSATSGQRITIGSTVDLAELVPLSTLVD